MRLCIAFVLSLASVTAAVADPRRDEEARAAYKAGASAYEAGDYQLAYDKFRESFQLSHEPALLYNISSALQGLQRPHDAAEALRSFLRVQPNDSERPKIEVRIATLEEEQRMIDLDKHKAPPAEAVAPPPPTAPNASATTSPPQVAPAAALVASPPPRRDRKRTAIIAGCVAGGVALVAGAIVLGVVLGDSQTTPYLSSTLGTHPGTR